MLKFKDLFKQYYIYLTIDDLKCDKHFYKTIYLDINTFYKHGSLMSLALEMDLNEYFKYIFKKNSLSCNKYTIGVDVTNSLAHHKVEIILECIFVGTKEQLNKICNIYGVSDRISPYNDKTKVNHHSANLIYDINPPNYSLGKNLL